MPGNKRWYLEANESGILFCRDGKEACNKGRPFGVIKDIFYGSEYAQAKQFKENAIEIIFKSGTKVLVNRQNFEWNKSSFSEEFKATTSASEFITVWQRITTVDSRTQQSVRRSESSSPESSQASSSHSTQSTVSVDSEVVPPASKRLCLERPSTVTTGSADHGQSPLHLNPIDDVILSKRMGLFRLPVSNLMQPQSDLRLIRKLDTTFVNNLKKRIQEDPTGPGVPPIAALCVNVDKENFAERYKDSYRYEVLGGQHTVAAKAELLRENPSNSLYNQVFAEVYIDLSEKESLRLASRHNNNGHFIHRMSHKDYVQSCRAMLYSISSEDIPAPTIHWKEICKECILTPDMSRTQCENIFSQAAFAPLVWEKAVIVMEKFEDGKLKDQKLSKKSLISKPEFKQHHFQCLHNLAPSFQEQILQQVADCKITLEEMKKQSNNFRALENVKKVFARATTTNSSWEEARVRFPWHTSEENFSQFLGLNFNKGVPDSFRSYIQAALKGEKHYEKNRHVYQGSEAVVIELSINNITLAKVQQSYPSYSGSNLILTSIPKEWDDTQIRQAALTCRQINCLESATLPYFNIAMICTCREQAVMVEESLRQCVEAVQVAFFYDQSISCTGSGFQLVDAVGVVVLGHFSIDGQVRKEHFSKRHHNIFVVDNKQKLRENIIELLSFPGNTIMEIIVETDQYSVSTGVISLKKGRSYVGVVGYARIAATIRKELACIEGNESYEEETDESHADNSE